MGHDRINVLTNPDTPELKLWSFAPTPFPNRPPFATTGHTTRTGTCTLVPACLPRHSVPLLLAS